MNSAEDILESCKGAYSTLVNSLVRELFTRI
jgi:hypothetical protein